MFIKTSKALNTQPLDTVSLLLLVIATVAAVKSSPVNS